MQRRAHPAAHRLRGDLQGHHRPGGDEGRYLLRRPGQGHAGGGDPRRHAGQGPGVPHQAAGRRVRCGRGDHDAGAGRAARARGHDPQGPAQGHHRQPGCPRGVRHVLQEQGSSEAVGRHRGLYALPH